MVNFNAPVWRCQTYIEAQLAIVEPILVSPSSSGRHKPIFDLTEYRLSETFRGIEKYVRNDHGVDPQVGESYFFLDREHHVFWLQGGWWYQGIYRLSESEQGTMLSYQINNVAPDSSRWLAPLVYWQQRSDWQRDFQSLIDTVNDRIR
ncbi:hypothetical protein [Spirosoma koreense]